MGIGKGNILILAGSTHSLIFNSRSAKQIARIELLSRANGICFCVGKSNSYFRPS